MSHQTCCCLAADLLTRVLLYVAASAPFIRLLLLSLQ